MEKALKAIRPTDVVLAVALTALGIGLMLENVNAHGQSVRIDSHSWAMIPVFALATLPVLFRRVNLFAVILASAAAMAVHVAAFGWVVRCGAGLPLALVLAYCTGRLIANRSSSLVALVLTIALQVLVLVRDSAAGLGILPVTAVLGVALWGVGLFVRTRYFATETSGRTEVAPVASHV